MTTTAVPRPKRKDALPQDLVTLSLRIPGWIYNPIKELSDKERRSITAQILIMLERQLKAEPKP